MRNEPQRSSLATESAAPLRVAYFAGTMRPGHDGVTRVLYRLADGLARHGVDGIFVSPIIPEITDRAVPMFRVPSVVFPLYRDYRVALPGAVHFERRLRDFRPDLIHINSPCSLGYAAVTHGRRHGIPVVATYHTHFASYAKYYGVKALESVSWSYLRTLYNRCDRTYVPSLPILEELREKGIRNLEHLPHGVDPQAFHPAYRSEAWRARVAPGGTQVLLYAGRLVWEKDLKTLMETVRILRSRRSDWRLVLVGDGPARKALQEGMPEAAFLGHQSGRDLATAFASSDVFVFPSTTETFGNVTLEAMASGTVPVCVREGGAWSMIQDGANGLVARPRDPEDFARRIEYLLDHPHRRAAMAEQALAYSRTQTWDEILCRLVAGYREVLLEASPRRSHKRSKAA
jgi:glycosyltransferase involved in cell wall biosynthesis